MIDSPRGDKAGDGCEEDLDWCDPTENGEERRTEARIQLVWPIGAIGNVW